MHSLPVALRRYLYLIYGSAITILIASFYTDISLSYYTTTESPNQLLFFVVFILITIAVEFSPIVYGNILVQNISTAILVAATFIFQPLYVIIISIVAPALYGLFYSKALHKTLFNIAFQAIVFGIVSILIASFGGAKELLGGVPASSDASTVSGIPALRDASIVINVSKDFTNLLKILFAFIVYLALSTGLMGVLFVLVNEQKLSAAWRETLDVVNPFDLALLPYGLILAWIWKSNPSGAYFLVGLIPLFAMHRSFSVHANLLKEQEATAKLAHQQRQVQEATTILLSAADVHTQLDTLLKHLMEVFPIHQASVLIWGELDEADEIVTRGHTGPTLPIDEWSEKLRLVCAQRHIVQLDQEYVTQTTNGHPVLLVPLVTPDDMVGCLVLLSGSSFAWATSDVRLLETFAAQAALAIYQARLIVHLKSSQGRVVQTERLAAIGTLAAGVAHEFNNLLAGISGIAQLALITNNAEEQHSALDTVAQAAQQGSSITRGLLTFARRLEPKRELADVHSAIEPVMLMLQAEFRRANIVVARNLAPVPLLYCDVGMLSQVLLNLMTNAIDAMYPDGGTLTIELYAQDGYVVLAVSDTGSGVPEHIRDRIFEPFVSSKASNNGKLHGGTGLGLAISYGIITEHGGTIAVSDREGGGTTMTIRLPLDPMQAMPPAPAEHGAATPLHMIVVDDEPMIAKALHGMLTQEGHVVYWFTEPRKALEALNREPVDLIFADLTMPEMDGLTLLAQVRQRMPWVKPVVITGHTDLRQLERVRAAGVTAIIEKPFSLDDIRAVVRQIRTA